jgi:hypothetical protein
LPHHTFSCSNENIVEASLKEEVTFYTFAIVLGSTNEFNTLDVELMFHLLG